MKEIIENKLEKYNYDFSVKGNTLNINLGYSLEIRIDFSQKGKYKITDQLKGWNYLTGMIEMNVSNALIYNVIGLLVITLFFIFLGRTSNLILFLIPISLWIIVWSVYYVLKSEIFKKQIIDWIEKQG